MVDTDDKKSTGRRKSKGDRYTLTVRSDAEPDRNEAESDRSEAAPEQTSNGFVGELVALSVKAIAVALSLFVLIISILTVAMPLSAMRVFNKLGMYERALNSGDKYIESRLDDANANKTNDKGEYTRLMSLSKLSDADMLEALEVCIDLSDDLMRDYVKSDKKSTAYFADKLDKYIRIYMSLSGENAISANKSKEILSSMKKPYHPFVYNYKHTLMTLDYTARVYSGDKSKLDMMMYNTNGGGEFMMSASDQSHNLAAVVINDDTAWNLQMRYIDWFVDYIDQLSVYLGIQEEKLGVTKTLTGIEATEKYNNVLNGDEFSMFITPQSGFSRIYDELMGTNGSADGSTIETRNYGLIFKFAQLAYNFDRSIDDDGKLHRLHWLRVLTTATDRIWNMLFLLFNSRSAYGQKSNDIVNEYNTDAFKYARMVIVGREDDGKPIYRDLVSIYNEEMADYLR